MASTVHGGMVYQSQSSLNFTFIPRFYCLLMVLKTGADFADLPTQDRDELSNLGSPPTESRGNQKTGATWMYDWMQDLMDFDNWKESVATDEDLSHVFAFRESKVYTLKRVREKLHRLQTTMVRFQIILHDRKMSAVSQISMLGVCSLRGECSTLYRFGVVEKNTPWLD